MRETIKICDLIEEYKNWYEQEYEEEFNYDFELDCLSIDSKEIEILEKNKNIIDLDHRTIEHIVIFKRIKDSKFFKVKWVERGYNDSSLEEEIATEVFPKTKTITYYE